MPASTRKPTRFPVMPMLLGTALLFGLTVGHLRPTIDLGSGCAGHEQGTDPAAVCYDPSFAPYDPADGLGAMAAAVGDHDCLEPETWHARRDGEVPTWAVMKHMDGTIEGMPFDEAWDYAEAGKAWTVSLCVDKEG